MFICLTFNFVFFVGMAMHEFKIFTTYFFFTLVILHLMHSSKIFQTPPFYVGFYCLCVKVYHKHAESTLSFVFTMSDCHLTI